MTAEGLKILIPRLIVMQSATPWDDVQTDVWARSLRNVPDDIALTAMDNIWATEKWRPAFSEFLAEVINVTDSVPSLREAISDIRGSFSGMAKHHQVHPAVTLALEKLGGLAVVGRMESKRLEEAMPTIWGQAVREWEDKARKQIISGNTGNIRSETLPGFVSALAHYQGSRALIEGITTR